ncbi:HNH endonuclease [Streptomyces sp. NPDC059757]|uniref:HNH endonuclease n=1 Tax=Streptomyces sp. NPDC059757 TaxID=3346935 RepID=UPI00364AA7FA
MVKAIVHDRDGGVCVRCGSDRDLTIHHRVNRGMGGAREPWINQAHNLLLSSPVRSEQRQEAYSTFLAAWDQAEKNFDGLVDSWEEESSIAREVEWHSGDGWESLGLDWARQTHEVEQSVTGPLEAIYLLGPDEVQQRVGNMASALANMRGLLMGIPRLAEQGSADSAWQEHPRLKVAMIEARARFLDASRAVLQTAPDTGRKWFR